MKKIYRIIAVLLLVCMMPVISAMASSEETPSGEAPSGEASSEEMSSAEMGSGEPAASGEMVSEASAEADASAEAESSNEAEASAEAEPTEEPEELDSQAFQVKIPYNDTTYGYGNVKLKVTGSVFSDGTYQIDSVKCYGYELISYMTDDYYTELCGLLVENGVVYEA